MGPLPPFDGITATYCPRRTLLDKLLVDAALESGFELREAFAVQELCLDGGRVTGVYGRLRGGTREKLQAPIYNARPTFACAYYAYWSGVPHTGVETYVRERRTIVLFPTNDDHVVVYVAWPYQEFDKFRADIENNYLQTLDLVPD